MKIFNLEADIKEQYQNAVNEDIAAGIDINYYHRIEFERSYYQGLVEDLGVESESDFILWNGILYTPLEKLTVYSKNEYMKELKAEITYSDFNEGNGKEVAFLIENKLYPATKFYSE